MPRYVADEAEQGVTVGAVRRQRDQRARLRLGVVEKPCSAGHTAAYADDERQGAECAKRGHLALDRDCPFEERHRPIDVVVAELLAGLEEELERPGIGDGAVAQACVLFGRQGDLKGVHDRARHALLHVENVVHRPAVLLGPELGVGLRIDELRGYSQRVAGAPDAAGEHVANTELASDLAGTLGAPFVLHRRRPRDHAQRTDAGQVGDELLG